MSRLVDVVMATRRRRAEVAAPQAPPAAAAEPPAIERAADPPLEAAVCFDVPGAGGPWLVADADAAARLNLPAGHWLTPADLSLLEGLQPDDRLEVLRWMRATGGRLVTAPAPARRYGAGERGWERWRMENIDRQITEYRAVKAGGGDV